MMSPVYRGGCWLKLLCIFGSWFSYYSHVKELTVREGLPLYICDAVIHNRVDRNKLAKWEGVEL